jgi:hypothetical protein
VSAIVARPHRSAPNTALSFGEPGLQITLTYSGPVPACQGPDKHTEQKHKIRMCFSKQLEHKFSHMPTLMHWGEHLSRVQLVEGRAVVPPIIAHAEPFYEMETCGYLGVPIVAAHNGLGCHLDIEVMRRSGAGGVLAGGDNGGDIDNRLKPLLDALALPLQPNQVPGHQWGQGQRMYCLLEDDALVSQLTISIKKWDEDPATPEQADHVQLRVDASIFIVAIRAYHFGF